MKKQTGLTLVTLMVMLALASMASLLAMRNLWVNEQLLNAEADLLRTLHKAHAVLPLAVADIVGSPTTPDDLRHTPGNASQTHAFFPASTQEYALLRERLASNLCDAGICAPNALTANATQASFWKTRTHLAWTLPPSDTPYGDDTVWYWVEIFPTHASSAPDFIYRITVRTQGVMPGTATTLQAIWKRTAPSSPTGQWHSWQILHD